MSGIIEPKPKVIMELSSPYKLNKKSKDSINQLTISSNEYSN